MSALRTLGRWLHWLTIHQWRLIDEDCRKEVEAERARAAGAAEPEPPTPRKTRRRKDRIAAPAPTLPAAGSGYDWRVIVVLAVVATSLTLLQYYGDRPNFYKLFPNDSADPYHTLKSYGWWSSWRFFGYVLLPAAFILMMPGERLRDYYLSFRGFFRHLWIYVGLFLIVLPCVVIAAQTDSFTRTYPFYRLANRSAFDFWTWQALYALQFLSLEFFFRGFMLHGLRRTMGSKAIFVMIVPYCMIHFGKPFAETMGAILAGVALGTLAMRTRSIWGGVLIHVGVALTMDLLAVADCPPAETGQPCRAR